MHTSITHTKHVCVFFTYYSIKSYLSCIAALIWNFLPLMYMFYVDLSRSYFCLKINFNQTVTQHPLIDTCTKDHTFILNRAHI